MKADIHIDNVNEIAMFYRDVDGQSRVKVDLHKASDLIKYVAYLYMSGDSANISISGVDKKTFEVIKENIHAAALAKLKKLKEQNQ